MSEQSSFYFLNRSTIKHLRLPFSLHLMPVFLFALSQAKYINWTYTIAVFIILHFLIYPASNGYNSYQDKDETSIGGLKHPPQVTKNLFYVTLLFDSIGLISSLFISFRFACCVFIYVLVSRAYSYRKLRLKKYAVIGFLTVFIFQGAFTYWMVSLGISEMEVDMYDHFICMIVSSLFIGSVYPLTQIYQHKADKKDGVITLSYKLGYNGTFIFSAILFFLATILLYYYFDKKHQPMALLLFFMMMLPVIIQLLVWFSRVKKSNTAANFENTMKMNFLASSCMNGYFLILISNNFLAWF